MTLIVVILLILLIVGLLPHWPYARHWGYGYNPSALLLVILLVVLLLALSGLIAF